MHIATTSLTARLSQYTGLGAVAASRRPSPWPEASARPKGHPNLGLRNRWYLLTTADELELSPLPLRVLGEDVVLWRDRTGKPRMMGDHCPHRGARLSLGDVIEGQLQCWYHHWRFDADGQCTMVPSQGGACALADSTRIEVVYPVREEAGYLWAWIGEDDPEPLTLPAELGDSSWSTFPESVEWGANWLLALENLVDIMHAPFLHARSITLNGGATEDRVTVTDHETGFEVHRKNQAGVNFDWVDVHLDTVPHVRLDIPLPASAGPGPPLRILGFLLPIDDDRMVAHFPRFRQVDGRERRIWRTLYRLRLRGTHMHVLNQDKRMLEGMRTIEQARGDGERLAQADRPVVHLRRRLEPLFEAQRKAFDLPESP